MSTTAPVSRSPHRSLAAHHPHRGAPIRRRGRRRVPAGPPAGVLAVLILIAVGPGVARLAAQSPSLEAGQKVRIDVEGRTRVFDVVGMTPEGLVVTFEGDQLTLAPERIRRLDVRVPRTRGGQVGHDALVGGLLGAAVGVGLGLAAADYSADCWICISPLEGAAMGAALVGLPGVATGALVGAIRPLGHSWRAVPVDGLEVRAGAGSDGVGLALVVRF